MALLFVMTATIAVGYLYLISKLIGEHMVLLGNADGGGVLGGALPVAEPNNPPHSCAHGRYEPGR